MQKCTNVSHAWFGQCLASKCTPLHIYDIYLCQSNHTSKTCSSLYSSGRLWLLLHLHPVIQDMLVIIDPVIIRKIAAHHEASGQLWWRDLIGWDMSRQLRNCADIKGAVRVGRRQDGLSTDTVWLSWCTLLVCLHYVCQHLCVWVVREGPRGLKWRKTFSMCVWVRVCAYVYVFVWYRWKTCLIFWVKY